MCLFSIIFHLILITACLTRITPHKYSLGLYHLLIILIITSFFLICLAEIGVRLIHLCILYAVKWGILHGTSYLYLSFGWISLINGISSFMGYFMPKLFLCKKSSCTNICARDKGIHALPEGISPKVNRILWPKHKLTYYDFKVQGISNYATLPGQLEL